MKAMIFAAGLGTRLRPITDRMPKALVPVGGVPVLEIVMRRLRGAGIGDFVINACHFSGMIEEFVARNAGRLGAHVSVSPEEDGPLETGGGIKRAGGMLGDGRFLVHNVDILSNLDIGWFIRQDAARDGEDCLASLLVCESQTADRYLLFDRDMCLAGWANVRTGEVRSPYPDFDPGSCRRLSFCGIHILSPEVFPMMEDWPDRFPIIDFYLAAAAGRKIRAVLAPEDFRFIDIGSPAKLEEAERADFWRGL